MTDHIPFPHVVANIGRTDLTFDGTVLSFPAPDPVWIGALADALRAARTALQERTTASLLRAMDAVNERWADPASPERREADEILGAVTGYPAAVIGPAL